MKSTLSACLVLAAFVNVWQSSAVPTAQPKGKPLVAVLPFKVEKGIQGDEALYARSFTAELSKSGKASVLSRKTVNARLKSRGYIVGEYDILFKAKGRGQKYDPIDLLAETIKAKEIGKALGVKYLISGNVAHLEVAVTGGGNNQKKASRTTFTTYLIATSTGEAIWSDEATEEGDDSATTRGSVKAARRQMEQLEKQLEGLDARAPVEKKADGQTCTSSVQCAGGACRAATCYTPGSKAFGQSCNFNAECRVGKCSAELLGLVNGTCVCNEDWHCGSGNYCNKGVAGIGSNDCRPKLDNGKACLKDHQCKSNRCYWGNCKN